MSAGFIESEVEAAALDWLAGCGWGVAHGSDIAPDAPGAECADYGAVVLEGRLRGALDRLNPDLPAEARDCDRLERRFVNPWGPFAPSCAVPLPSRV